ncbi:MAG: GNAT family N-acetyltransferase [Chloroflexota bacterium]|nr:GNAT family N-acetyltransferase [Chloroflexota bacterium]
MPFSLTIDHELELRLFEERHAAPLFSLTDRNREHLRVWLPWVDHTRSAGDTRAFIWQSLQQFAGNNGLNAGIWYQGELVGAIGLRFLDWNAKRTEIGYWLSQDMEGRGIMTRAVSALLDYIFGDLGLNRVEIRAATGNRRSRAVPERLGFTHEGTIRQEERLTDSYTDSAVYGILAEEWACRSR